MAEEVPERRFGSVVLTGLASAALAAVAGAKPWFAAALDFKLVPGVRETNLTADLPLALALSLVVLAGWGALLVMRGRPRRVVAGISLLAAAGTVACVVVAPFTLPGQVRSRLLEAAGDASVGPTGWYVTAAVASLLSLASLALAWRLVPGWPTMGRQYDAPGGQVAARQVDPDNQRAVWDALDDGRDPTVPEEASGPHRPEQPH